MSAGDFTENLQVSEKRPQSRFYSSRLGRFVQADTLIPGSGSPQSLNRYAYVFNNPVLFYDPTGNCPEGSRLLDGVYCTGEGSSMESYLEHDQFIYSPGYSPYESPPVISQLPVDEDEIDWVQLYGGTQFAANDKEDFDAGRPNYNYCGYAQCFHAGIDLGAAWGTPVHSGVYGTISHIWNEGPNGGWKIIITTPDGYQMRIEHLAFISPGLTSGDLVNASTVIGGVGNPTGDPSGGNDHIHFEIRYNPNSDGYMQNIANPTRFMSDNTYQTIVDIAANQVASGDASLTSGVTLIYGDGNPLSQPDIQRGGESLLP